NHLKSKGSACTAPDAGDGQGNCNQVRLNAVHELTQWLAGNPTATGDSDVLLVGDYNSYAMEDPIRALEDAGFVHLVKSRLGADAYSYAFDGQWGYLDHALASASLDAQVTGVADYHINSDEPSVLDYNTDFKTPAQVASLYAPDQYRVSDHDPVLIGLALTPNNRAPSASDVSVTTPEDTAAAVTLEGTDPDGDALTYTVTSSPAHGTLSGTAPNLTYTPAGDYSGPDSFTYTVSDGTLTSAPATVSITVTAVNDAPTVAIVAASCFSDTAGQIGVTTSDVEGANPTVSGSSSNTALVRNSDIVVSGSGSNRTVTVSGVSGRSGTAVITLTASDGSASSTTTFTVRIGTNQADTLTGGAGVDVIIGNNGDDTLRGGDEIDAVCGGNGNDTLFGDGGNDALSGGSGDDQLTGGTGADRFDGGKGRDTATDANIGTGDTTVNIP
ncbi:MAG: Ig-like domain-containing protein, partial [Pedococcus sp.]